MLVLIPLEIKSLTAGLRIIFSSLDRGVSYRVLGGRRKKAEHAVRQSKTPLWRATRFRKIQKIKMANDTWKTHPFSYLLSLFKKHVPYSLIIVSSIPRYQWIADRSCVSVCMYVSVFVFMCHRVIHVSIPMFLRWLRFSFCKKTLSVTGWSLPLTANSSVGMLSITSVSSSSLSFSSASIIECVNMWFGFILCSCSSFILNWRALLGVNCISFVCSGWLVFNDWRGGHCWRLNWFHVVISTSTRSRISQYQKKVQTRKYKKIDSPIPNWNFQ